MNKFKVGDWVLADNIGFGRIEKIVDRVDIPQELSGCYVETLDGLYWCFMPNIKKIDTIKLTRLIPDCVIDE